MDRRNQEMPSPVRPEESKNRSSGEKGSGSAPQTPRQRKEKAGTKPAEVKGRYCPKCRGRYSWEDTHCKEDGTDLRDCSIFATWIADELFSGGSAELSTCYERQCPLCGKRFPFEITQCPEDGEALGTVARQEGPRPGEPPPEELLGRVLGSKWRLTKFVSGGGFGWVFRGERVGLGQPVAVKLLKINLSVSPQYRRRFHAEATLLSRLDYPRVVRLIDYGEEEDTPYLVMQYLSEQHLRELIEGHALTLGEKVEIMRQVALALAEAHRVDPARGNKPIVHLDLKPEHIFVRRQQEELHVTVIDFGIAEMLAGSESAPSGEGRMRTVAGTPPYMAPERFDNEVDPACDIYSFGVTFYELLTGKRPFSGRTLAEIEKAHRAAPPPALRRDRRGEKLPHELRRLIEECMAKEKEARPSARDVAYTLQAYLSRTRRRKALAACALLAALAALGFGLYRYFYPPERRIEVELNVPAERSHYVGPGGSLIGRTENMPEGSVVELVPVQDPSLVLARTSLRGGAIRLDLSQLPPAKDLSVLVRAHGERYRARSQPFRLVIDPEKPRFLPLEPAQQGMLIRKGSEERSWIVHWKGSVRFRVEESHPRFLLLEKRTEKGTSQLAEKAHCCELVLPVAEIGSEGENVLLTAKAGDKAGNESEESFEFRIRGSVRLLSLDPTEGSLPKGALVRREGGIVKEVFFPTAELSVAGTVLGEPKLVEIAGEGVTSAVQSFEEEKDNKWRFSLEVKGLAEGKNELTLRVKNLFDQEDHRSTLHVNVRTRPYEIRLVREGSRIVARCTEQPVSEISQVLPKGKLQVRRLDETGVLKSLSGAAIDKGLDLAEVSRHGDGRYLFELIGNDEYGREVQTDLWCVVDNTPPRITRLTEAGGLGSADHPLLLGTEEKARFRFTVSDATPVHVKAYLENHPLAVTQHGDAYEISIADSKLRPFENRAQLIAFDRRGKPPPGTLWFPDAPLQATESFVVYAMEKKPPQILQHDPQEGQARFSSRIGVMVKTDWTAAKVEANGKELSAKRTETGIDRPQKRFEGDIERPDLGLIRLQAWSVRRDEVEGTEKWITIVVEPREGELLKLRLRGMIFEFVFLRQREKRFFLSLPLTKDQFARFLKDTGYQWPAKNDLRGDGPACGISKEDAEAYLKWIGEGVHLPTYEQYKALLEGTDEKKLKDRKLLEVFEWLQDEAPEEPRGLLAGMSREVPLKYRIKIRDWKPIRRAVHDRGQDFGFRFVLPFESFLKLSDTHEAKAR